VAKINGGAADAEMVGGFGDGELFAMLSLYHNRKPN
jgi:hypothetical protein